MAISKVRLLLATAAATAWLIAVLGSALLGLESSAAATAGPPTASAHQQVGRWCSGTHASRGFWPTHARIGVLHRTYRVVRVPREHGAIGTPPVTTRGKRLIGWDRAVMPGARRGTVVIDAHTWPDGSALGNAMLRRLREGNRIRISRGSNDVCYWIVKRTSYPRNRIPMGSIARTGGKPRLAIIVCSGTRLGPGNWLRRTVWIGIPVGR